MQNVGDVDLSRYNPVHPPSYYGSVNICETGSVRPTEPLSESVFTLLSSINADVSIWDGSRGVLGRAYNSSYLPNPPVQRQPLSMEQLRTLRTKYVELKRNMRRTKTRHGLQKELDTKRILHAQLMEAIDALEDKIHALQKRVYKGGGYWSKSELSFDDSKDGLKWMIERREEELERARAAAEVLERKMMEVKVDLKEKKDGLLRQLSILHKVFIHTNVEWELLAKMFGGEGAEELLEMAERVERRCGECWVRTLRAKRFYVDAKLGLRHLYQVENVLKGILEHLWEAMQSYRGGREGLPSVVGVGYRLGYVRKQWGEVEKGMREGIKYLRVTSLKGEIGERGMSEGFLRKMGRGWGTRRGERIRTLYEAAKEGYQRVSKVFDEQGEWVERSLEEVRRREREEGEKNEQLIEMWEKLLGVVEEWKTGCE